MSPRQFERCALANVIYERGEQPSVSRGFGEVAAIQQALPDWLAPVLGVLTQFGDAWFLFVLLGGLYWHRPRRHESLLLVVGTAAIGTGLLQYLKYLFELPRPNQVLLSPELVPGVVRPLYEATAFASGFGFPSGHATGATLVYVGLAAVLPVGTSRQRYATAAALAVLVSFTRVALGLHVAVDVIAGMALGGSLVALTVGGIRPAISDHLTVVFSLSVVTTGLFLVESGATTESLLAVGGALGLLGGWNLVALWQRTGAGSRVSSVRRLVVAVTAFLLVAALALAPLAGIRLALGGVAGLATAALVTLPQRPNGTAAADRNGYSDQ